MTSGLSSNQPSKQTDKCRPRARPARVREIRLTELLTRYVADL